MPYIRSNRGVGSYQQSPFNVEWPYNRNAPKGMGCAGSCVCGGTCGGGDHDHGMGLFDSADPTTWGLGEWGTIAVGGYVAVSAFHDVSRGARSLKSGRVRKAAGKATSGIGSIVLLGGAAYAAYYLWQKSGAASTAGLSDYQAQKYVAPQILTMPVNSAQIRIPAGW